MRFAREIIDTLKIELGFLKFRSVELNVHNKISSSKVIMDAFLTGLDNLTVLFKASTWVVN